jgi:signal transducing adaptor molecule
MSIESLVDQITSPNLPDDDYGLLLDLVELVNKNPTTNVIETLRFLKVKFQSTNANTLLRSITLLDFLAQNCGAMMKANIATPDFVNNNLLPIIDDSLIHISVKFALIKEIYKLSIAFKDDESLSIMKLTFNNLKFKVPSLCNDAIDEVDGKKKLLNSNYSNNDPISKAAAVEEDLELKKAIELSLKESSSYNNSNNGRPPAAVPFQQPQIQSQSQSQPQSQSQLQSQPQPQPQLQSQQPSPQISTIPQIIQPAQQDQLIEDISKPDKVVALYDLSSDDEDTLSFKKDDIITIVEEINKDWLRGCLHGRAGIVPTNYVKKIPKTIESDLQNLISTLNSSFDIETTLSQLMDLNKKVKTSSMTSQQFESCLLSNSFPNKIQKIEQIKNNLKQILELHKLKLLELQSLQSNIDNSLQIYQNLITELAPAPENPEISNFIQTYPDISSLSINPSAPLKLQTQPGIPTLQPQSTQNQISSTSTGSVNHYLQMQQQQQQQQPPPPPAQQQSPSTNMYNFNM